MKIDRTIFALSLLLACPAIAGNGPLTHTEPVLTGDTVQRIYRPATKSKSPVAMYPLGNMFDQGVGVAKNPEETFKWYYRSAELGNGDAMNCLGIAYATGQGAPRNYALSLRWFFKAAEKGSIQAMSNIAKSYYLGAGIPVDYSEAARWFELAAKHGDPGAMNNLALMYEKGTGVAQDSNVALALFAWSAKRGYPLAMMNLGILYANGETVKQDNLVAFAWMGAALEAGLRGEDRDAVTRELGTLAARFSAGELTRARKLGGEILSEVVRHRQSRKGQSDPASPRPYVS